jgi:type I restriction enzyme S subunit
VEIDRGYKQTEVGVIPEDWGVATVGDEFSIQLGKMLDAEKNVGLPKPFLGNRAVQWGRIDLSDIGSIKLTTSDIQRFRLRAGDLLVCEGGEVGRAAVWCEPIGECYYQKALHRLRPKRGYNVKLMLNFLQRLASTGFLFNFVTQTSIAHLPKDKFQTVPLPVPPTKVEQENIAEALSDADALIESLDQLVEKKRHLKHGAVQELLTGKRRLPGFENNSRYKRTEVGMIPEDWRIKTIEQIATVGRGRVISHKEIARSFDPRYPVYSSQTSNDGVMGYLDTFEFEGDYITWTTDGAHAGTVFYRSGRFNCTNVCGTIKLSWDNYCFVAKVLAGIASRHVSRHLGNPKLMNDVMKHIKIPLPPTKAEQDSIATVLSDMDAEIAVLEAKLTKARNLKQGMMQELLTGRIRLL